MNRRAAAVVILLAWAGSLGWLAVRQRASVGVAQRTRAIQRVGPGGATYALLRDSIQIGMMTRSVDTLPGEVRIQEQWDLARPAPTPPGILRTSLRHTVVLTRDLRLLRFDSRRSGDAPPLAVSGDVLDDSLLIWHSESRGRRFADTLHSGGAAWTTTAALPLVLAYGATPANRLAVRLFDPLTFRQARTDIAIARDSIAAVPDSAVLDSVALTWRVAHRDTLRATEFAWREGPTLRVLWVDPSGMPLTFPGPFGVTAERGAFEIIRAGYRASRSDTSATSR